MHALKVQPTIQSIPRVAAHKLGLYAAATDARQRRAIVKDQQRPREFAEWRYFEAREAMVDHLLDGLADAEDLFIVIEYLASGFVTSPLATQNAALCIEALSHFLKHRDPSRLAGFALERGPENPPTIGLAGVQINVEPDLILRGKDKLDRPIVGAVKLHLSKTQPLDEESGANTATLLHQHALQHVARPGEIAAPRACQVWDVFTGKVYAAPASTTNRLHALRACCEEIALRWGR